MTLKLTRQVDRLHVRVYADRQAMGEAAGREAAEAIKERLREAGTARIIFAAAPSQNEFLQTLAADAEIDWSRITVFHMDEYIGLSTDAPQLFSRFLREGLFDRVRPGTVHLLDASVDAETEMRRYAGLLAEAPIDIVCLGIGENGHIAFNDPPVADFSDPFAVKAVELDEACRKQQVNDGCFAKLADVPTHAMTLTIPTLMAGGRLFCMVPGPTKRDAVRHTLEGPIGTACPATILRTHPACTLYVDEDSYGLGWSGRYGV
ncbi:glucosamine-6-phosphate deaminase [Paenibacillus cymbidii]|uniref:glucosamine-6-phosphate deaminase n=1 Tax=Paenibacillus cymbidii TaxID=1639034 RepID=UPI00107FD67D|nr:glucosamine-6-phosphate deaminase [Paenibacillus cymbidii]